MTMIIRRVPTRIQITYFRTSKNIQHKLMDLPCIIESQKTYNKNLYFKTGDISQNVSCGR